MKKILTGIFLFLVITSGNLFSQDIPLLYFCEDYIDGEEIGKSNVFTTGYLTVMVDLRPAGISFDTYRVKLILTKVKDEYGNNISRENIESIPFNVEPDWDYSYFQDEENLGFREAGTYEVTLLKTNGEKIVSGIVKIVSN